MTADERSRCEWAGSSPGPMMDYHDTEWGVPIHDDRELFQLLCLEGAQAGLSWSSILNRRAGYSDAFCGFDIAAVAAFDEEKAEELRSDARIIRNRAKIKAFINNARSVLQLQESGESLDRFLWSFVGGQTIVNRWHSMDKVPSETPESLAMSKALKKRGLSFVGPTICYAFMQSAGMVNDHVLTCFRHGEV